MIFIPCARNFISFAHDTNLFCSGPDIKVLLKTLEKELIVLKAWFDSNKILLNEKKKKIMVYGG